VQVIITTIGTIESLTKTPTAKEDNAPILNGYAPITWDGLTAFFAKGARVNPAVFGLEIPKQAKNRNNSAIVPYNPKSSFIAKIKKAKLIAIWTTNAPKIICSLENLLNNKEFNWLEPIKLTDIKAKIQP